MKRINFPLNISESCHIFFVSYLISGKLIRSALQTIIPIPIIFNWILFYSILFLISFLSFRLVIKRINFYEIVPFICIILFICLSCLGNLEYLGMYIEFLHKVCLGMIGYIWIRTCTNLIYVLNCLEYFSILTVPSACCLAYNSGVLDNYSIFLGYLILPNALTSCNAVFRHRKILCIIFIINTIFCFSSMIFCGARGPVVCFILFLGMRVFFGIRKLIEKIALIFFLVAITIILLQFHNNFINNAKIYATDMRLSARTLSTIEEGSFFESKGRELIRSYCYEIIKYNFFTGVGIGSDRILIADSIGNNSQIKETRGYYPHNLFLELYMQFGIINGTILTVLLFSLIIRTMIKNKIPNDIREILFILVGIGLFPLFFSTSYLLWPQFYYMIAASITVLLFSRENIKNKISNVKI